MIIRVLCQFDVKVTSELSKRVIKVIEIVASTSSRVLLPSISSVYSGMNSNIFTLLILVEKLIEKITKNEAVKHHAALTKFFLEALEFRTMTHQSTDNDDVTRDQVQLVEKQTCSALVRLALKLPEASLRPLIYKIFTWATLEGSPLTRLFSLYSLYSSLAEALKSMVSHVTKMFYFKFYFF